ncbi:hypothetical protein MY4038_009765 [Beauveria bassiana]
MKYVIILTSAAALVGAAPYCEPATMEADEPRPAVATDGYARKLPFIQSGAFDGIYCDMARVTQFQHTDEKCGTEVFC